MVWALLAILGVPIWLIVGVLLAALRSRRTFRRQPGVVRVNVRPASADAWPRLPSYARVIHDVIVMTSGLALVRTTVHGVREATVLPDVSGQVRGLTDPVVLALTYDDGTQVQLATERPLEAGLAALAGA